MIKPERLKAAMERAGLSQSELGRRAKMSSSMIGKLVRGESRGSAHIYEIARALEVSADYLAGNSDELPQLTPVTADENKAHKVAMTEGDDDIVEIMELDLAFGMGGGSYLDLPVRPKGRKFARDWLRLFTNSPPSRVFLAKGIGDSMSPTIQNDDIVIIDTAQSLVGMGDQIWAVAYGNFGLIKRLRPLPSGGIKIMSDNPLVESETAYDSELHVIGKVVAVVRKMAG